MSLPANESPVVLVIGYGSQLRGDDRLGPDVAELLMQQFTDPRVQIRARPSLTPELAADAAQVELVVFVDCSAEGPVGEVVQREVPPVTDRELSLVHFLDPAALLAWTDFAYGKQPRGLIVTVAGASFEIDANLTPILAQALPEVARQVTQIVNDHLQNRVPAHA